MGERNGEPIIAGVGAVETVTRVAEAFQSNVGRAIVSKEEEIRLCLVTLLCEGHLLIEDVPRVGKTMLAKALARPLDCTVRRTQLTPDLLPSDAPAVREVFVKPELRDYIARLVGRTRGNPEVALGASTRGTLHLFHASQALAAIQGRGYVLPDDIKTLAESVLAHRIILRPNAEMQGQSAGKLVAGLLEREHVPQMAYDG